MAIIKDDTIWAVNAESTEGTAVGPASASDGYVQANMDGTELTPSKELKERNIFTGTLIAANPRLGMVGVQGGMGVEAKASGTEGSAPGYAILLESLLADVDTISTTTTTKSSGNTGSVLQIQDADISKFTVNDIILIKQSGAHHPCVVTVVDSSSGTANITVSPAKASGSFSNSVVISKAKTYKPQDTGHKSFTVNAYWGSGGDGVRQRAIGCRTSGLTLEGFSTGEIPSFNFNFEGMNFDQTASTNASHTPTYDTSLPSVVLSSRVYKGGSSIQIEGVELSIEQPIAWLKATSSDTGKVAGRAAGKRKITGTIKPYTDATSVSNFTNWVAGTTFSMFLFTAVPTSTSGEYSMGSVVGIYLPACFITSVKYADLDGVIVEEVQFQATGGDTGSSSEIAIGFI